MTDNTLVAVLYGEFPNWQGGYDKRDFINIYKKDIKKELSKQSIFEYCNSFNALNIQIVYSPIIEQLEDLQKDGALVSIDDMDKQL